MRSLALTVPAMTIHKSKGLEFHTVIFLGLEDFSVVEFRGPVRRGEARIFRGIFEGYPLRYLYLFGFTRREIRSYEAGQVTDWPSLLDPPTLQVLTINLRGPT